MALAISSSGTLSTTVDNTERSIVTANAVGTYRLRIDGNAIADGDVIELRWKLKLLTGGTARTGRVGFFYGALPADDKMIDSEYIELTNTDATALDFTIKHPLGTTRSLPWVLSLWT